MYQSPCLCSRFHHVHVLAGLRPVIIRLYCFWVPVVLRELVAIVVCFAQNFKSLASSHRCRASTGIDCRFRVLVIDRIANWLFESRDLYLLAPGLTRRKCRIVLFHQDLAREKITPVLRLILYFVSIHPVYLIVNRFLLSLWEKVPPCSWRNHSVSFG